MKSIFLKRVLNSKYTLIMLGLILVVCIKYYGDINKETKEFNFVLNYGVAENKRPKNIVNTINDTLVLDLVDNGTKKVKLNFTEEEMKQIEKFIIDNKVMELPSKITYETKTDIGRVKSYLTIYIGGVKKDFEWMTMGFSKDYTTDMKNAVVTLNELEQKILNILENKDGYRELMKQRKGGYL